VALDSLQHMADLMCEYMSQQDSRGLRIPLDFILQPVHQKCHARTFVQVRIGECHGGGTPALRGPVVEIEYYLPASRLLLTARRRCIAETPDHLNTDVGISLLNNPARLTKRPVHAAVDHMRQENFHNGLIAFAAARAGPIQGVVNPLPNPGDSTPSSEPGKPSIGT
jgi:hypothetical protein